MLFSTFDVSVHDNVATVTFNRPERRNSFTSMMCLELAELLDWTDGEDQVRAVVVTGSGPSFCACGP